MINTVDKDAICERLYVMFLNKETINTTVIRRLLSDALHIPTIGKVDAIKTHLTQMVLKHMSENKRDKDKKCCKCDREFFVLHEIRGEKYCCECMNKDIENNDKEYHLASFSTAAMRVEY